MAVIYVKEQGSMIQKRGERIVVTKAGKTLLEIPVIQTENMALIGNVQISTQALYASDIGRTGKHTHHQSCIGTENAAGFCRTRGCVQQGNFRIRRAAYGGASINTVI